MASLLQWRDERLTGFLVFSFFHVTIFITCVEEFQLLVLMITTRLRVGWCIFLKKIFRFFVFLDASKTCKQNEKMFDIIKDVSLFIYVFYFLILFTFVFLIKIHKEYEMGLFAKWMIHGNLISRFLFSSFIRYFLSAKFRKFWQSSRIK